MKKKRKILIPLGELKHRFMADRNTMTHIILHLRDLQELPNMAYLSIFERQCLKDFEKDLTDFNADRMGDILDRVNDLIEEA